MTEVKLPPREKGLCSYLVWLVPGPLGRSGAPSGVCQLEDGHEGIHEIGRLGVSAAWQEYREKTGDSGR